MPRFFYDRSGVTLVELMVTVALFGVLSLAMMDLFGENARMSATTQNDAHLSEQLAEFSSAIENSLTNTTQLISCTCATANNCIFDETTIASPKLLTGLKPTTDDCMDTTKTNCSGKPTAAPGLTIIEWESEEANDPSQVASGNCVQGAQPIVPAWKSDVSQIALRGCKKRFKLNFVQPTDTTPGQLLIYQVDPVTGVIAAGAPPAHSLIGVYSFRCGQLPLPIMGGTVAATDHFRMQLRMKTRSNNIAAPTAANFESWVPLAGSKNFLRGTHRSWASDISFRNLNTPGIQFGKTNTFPSCAADLAFQPDGNCCSGYMDGTGKCMPMTACLPRNSAAPPAIFSQCCSHKIGVGGNCL